MSTPGDSESNGNNTKRAAIGMVIGGNMKQKLHDGVGSDRGSKHNTKQTDLDMNIQYGINSMEEVKELKEILKSPIG